MRRLRLLLDANVIVNAQVRDLICRLAEDSASIPPERLGDDLGVAGSEDRGRP